MAKLPGDRGSLIIAIAPSIRLMSARVP